MAQSTVQYGILAWGGCNTTLMKKINVAQKYIIKIVLHKPRTFSSETIFITFNVLTTNQLYHKNVLLYVYKNNLINLKPYNYNIRNNNVVIPTIKTSKCSNSFFFVGLRLIQNLPNTLCNYSS